MPDDLERSPDEPRSESPPDRSAPAGMSEDQLAEAKQYGRIDLIFSLADKALDVAYLSVMAFLFASAIGGRLAAAPLLGSSRWLQLIAMFLIVMAAHVCVSFPLSYYSGHVLEHRFELSTQTFRRWLWQYTKRNLLAVAFGLLLVPGLYLLIWTTGPYWWLIAAGAFFLVSVLLGQLAPVLILPLFYKIEKLDEPEIAQRISRLAEGTGLSIEGVYRMDMSDETVKANAMLAGLGKTRRVLLGDTLLNGFTTDEIEVVFAHEIGHHVFRHIRKMILAGVLYSAAGFWICDRVLAGLAGLDGGRIDYATLPVSTLPTIMLILTVFAMLLEPLQNLISRHYERQCDRYALERTALNDAYTSAFRKLARLNKDDPSPHWLDVLLFHSHPPIAERLAMSEGSSPATPPESA